MPTLAALMALAVMASVVTAHADAAPTIVTLRTRSAVFGIDAKGSLSMLSVRGRGDCLAVGQPAPLLSVRVDGKLHAPDRADWDAQKRQLTLRYADVGVTAVVSAEAKPGHLVLTVADLQPAGRTDLAVWGPYPTKIRDIVGETVGVVRDAQTAVGLQALNPKTIGGSPAREDDEDAGYGEDDPGTYPNLPAELLKGQGWRGDVARATAFGSVLQAYCRDRSRERVISNWGHDRYDAPAFQDGGIVGSKIALFAGPASKALATIGEIEIAEGLPHPMIDGVWGKVSPGATASYLIVDFSEANVDRAIEMTRRAGLKYLYHSSPFETWGHFKLKPELFPHGWEGLKACVDKARAVGVHIGFHTLSNFITPNDPYVTPIPDPRLARIGSSALTADVDAAQDEIPVASPDLFLKVSTLNTVRVGEELIRFLAISPQAPWRLMGCVRGAWGTHAAAHTSGTAVDSLLDHPYKVFHGDASLSQEVARNIADLFNHVGALQTSFDGLEGNLSTTLGQYGKTLFTKAWYDALSPELRGHVINDASNPGHYNWHINTRMNWGEPWYAGFRESQTLYRFKNQVYFERNFMPHMLGWFALRPETSMEDAEWLLARAAGFDAGFTLATSLASTAQLEADPASAETSKRFGATTAILEAVRQWETARMAGAFPPEVKALLRDNTREFHLQPAGKARLKQWDLYEAHIARFTCDTAQSTTAEFEVHTADAEQPLQWIARSTAKEPIAGLTVEIDGAPVIDLKAMAIPAEANIRYSGGSEAVIYDAAWKELTRVPVDAKRAVIGPGAHRLKIGWTGRTEGGLKIETRTYDPAVRIVARARRQSK
jgi:hypothetical protein